MDKGPHHRAATASAEIRNEATRRVFLLTTAAVTCGLGILADLTRVCAQPSAAAALDDPNFLQLSKAVTGYADLDATTASRLLVALDRADPAFIDHAAALAQLARVGQSPEDLLSAAKAAGLGETMLALVAAWYTGTVGHGEQAEMVSYVEALMYRPVSDGLPAPTYCLKGPLWWTEPPPPAGINAPATPKGG